MQLISSKRVSEESKKRMETVEIEQSEEEFKNIQNFMARYEVIICDKLSMLPGNLHS